MKEINTKTLLVNYFIISGKNEISVPMLKSLGVTLERMFQQKSELYVDITRSGFMEAFDSDQKPVLKEDRENHVIYTEDIEFLKEKRKDPNFLKEDINWDLPEDLRVRFERVIAVFCKADGDWKRFQHMLLDDIITKKSSIVDEEVEHRERVKKTFEFAEKQHKEISKNIAKSIQKMNEYGIEHENIYSAERLNFLLNEINKFNELLSESAKVFLGLNLCGNKKLPHVDIISASNLIINEMDDDTVEIIKSRYFKPGIYKKVRDISWEIPFSHTETSNKNPHRRFPEIPKPFDPKTNYDIKRFALILELQARIEGMKAENMDRHNLGYSIAYTDGHFQEIAEELRVLANKPDEEL